MIPLPRPVGIASDDETLVVEFDRPVDPDQVCRDLGSALPRDIALAGARILAQGEKLVPAEVCYRLDDPGVTPQALPDTIQSMLDAESLFVTRTSPKWPSPRTLNVRPYIADLCTDGRRVICTLRVTNEGTAKPAEIAGLLGWNPDFINHHIRRLSVRWR